MLEKNEPFIARFLGEVRRKLLDTGTRNRLIHVNRANLRANCLNIINEKSDPIYSLLRLKAKDMRFKAMGKDKKGKDDEMLFALPDNDITDGSSRLIDTFIETPLGPDALTRRLLRLSGDAKTAEEEQGLNILYLALGFLIWKESDSTGTKRETPLVLLPVRLVRDQKTSEFKLKCLDDDITTNLPLQERLRQDFGIRLPDIDEGEGWLPSSYFAQVADAISGQKDWSIDTDGMQLGFFSFAKLLMHRDLSQEAWPEGAFANNPFLRGLLTDGFAEDPPFFAPGDRLDERLAPAKLIQVVDADASQTKVIEEVREGRSLVVQGPPGTGKSQTITNIIAASVYDGKSVLFVAEKMAALSVVHDRLVRCGLRDIFLELHSRTANKKALVQELGRTLMASSIKLPKVGSSEPLKKTRDELNRISNLLHTPIPGSTETPFHAISDIIGFMGKGASPPSIPLEGLAGLDHETRLAVLKAIDAFVAAVERAGEKQRHPFRGSMARDLQPTDLSRLETELKAAVEAQDALLAKANKIAAKINQTEPRTFDAISKLCAGLESLTTAPGEVKSLLPNLFEHAGRPRLTEALEAGANWAAARKAIDCTYVEAAWNANLADLRTMLAKGQASWLVRIFGAYRSASAELSALLMIPLPKTPAERLQVVDNLIKVQNLRRALTDEEAWLQSVLGSEWRGERTAFDSCLDAARWLSTAHGTGAFSTVEQMTSALAVPNVASMANDLSTLLNRARTLVAVPISRLQLDLVEAGLGHHIDTVGLDIVRDVFSDMAADVSRYSEWAELLHTATVLVDHGSGAIVDAVYEGRLEPSQARIEFSYACAEARWDDARNKLPELNKLSQRDRHDLVRLFCQFDKDRIENTKTLILARHFMRMPRETGSEMKIIRGEIGRKRGHKPIRWVMKHAGSAVQRIKPVMLMSPLSVAQFLPPGSVTFDLLVIDEASQIRPEDALGVIMRAKQIVVVGDQKQLPPTSFFDRLVNEVDENDEGEDTIAPGAAAADMESILSLCEARGLQKQMLEWHYRSRDPSLIRVNNAEFYGDRLILPPSPLQLDPDYGLKFRHVPGVYARGGSGLGRQGTNRIEAEAVVEAVVKHAQTWPELSLGIVAFSKTQADMLTEVLEFERRRNSALDAFLREGKTEDVFIKNIENVQGDERDVILVSVCYGPQEPNGRLTTMSFGPINTEGGERRLNVLFSRARVRCEIFASFDPGDIDVSRSSREGPRVLKRFLDFAKTGIMESSVITGLDADSPFEEDVATVIRSFGYLADIQVGTAGFRIDIGVRHPSRPGQYLLAVECDGATYHSALWARERDRQRQDILENLGWRFHRIWSTDWFHHRNREIERLRLALENARVISETGIRARGANHAITIPQDGNCLPETDNRVNNTRLQG
ncbi:DUF4011 domain-containing protein [Haematospirillum jordaniae]|uniref:DUF4011 domain-containing protein n=1 Tax=Haematospirillum jordaniae TaxID=1549855 RepID=UPI00143330D9|nr:DUF4011 domain-containing protein [Haematospirillum jordaniae]NKD44991.1 DUF4011 domain-containing protein [Haematospirillum jordaniae]NKD92840.1 DUF4011 domain-containing protein [Haematospirillum jordaniae]